MKLTDNNDLVQLWINMKLIATNIYHPIREIAVGDATLPIAIQRQLGYKLEAELMRQIYGRITEGTKFSINLIRNLQPSAAPETSW